ncbi:hypothetical protein NWF32_10800 [Pseudomonas qingdaonensis]|nr:hypothetical protein [Pseudomonas qingdaonensis]
MDFILHSVNHLLQQEFGQTLGSKGVHIIDPFTGTGTFITRLIQSGLIKPEELSHKFKHEIHANELVLLAYYIAAINIEAAYHGQVIDEYTPFEGICLTDTFQMYEKDDLVDALLEDNSARRKRQKNLDIRVIVGNPPYSIGQGSQNDNNQNVSYPALDRRIEETYAAHSEATLSRGLYDSYIRSIRWASDRIGNAGIIGFVTNAGFLDAASQDGCANAWRMSFPASMCSTCAATSAPVAKPLAKKEARYSAVVAGHLSPFRYWLRIPTHMLRARFFSRHWRLSESR